jgi:UDP-glucose 4-epimerase
LNDLYRHYQGKRVIVTGGLGFIGSALALRLVELGGRVIVVDSSVAGCGANEANLDPVRASISLVRKDIGDATWAESVIRSADVVFNLAGEVSHTHSMEWPSRDAEINTLSQIRFLECCARRRPGLRVIYAGTRQVYGRPLYLPVDENHPFQPVDFNGIHKAAAIQQHLMYDRLGVLEAVVLNLTNVYGPRMALWEPCQGFLGGFLRRLLLGQRLEVFGDGRQLRDPLYVDDAVEAFLLAGAAPRVPSPLYNVGGPEALTLWEIATLAHSLAGGPDPVLKPFPPERKQIDIGSYQTNWTRIRAELGWAPRTRFADGLSRTLAFYRSAARHFLGPGHRVGCGLTEEAAAAAGAKAAAL